MRLTNNSPPKKFQPYQKRLMPPGAPINAQLYTNQNMPASTAGFNERSKLSTGGIGSGGGFTNTGGNGGHLNRGSPPPPVNLEGSIISKKVHITVSISAEAFAAAARTQNNASNHNNNQNHQRSKQMQVATTSSPHQTILN
jgi:hypothetical protein